MTKTIKYTGTIDRWPELAVTGGQAMWRLSQQEQRSDAEAEMLLLTGQFLLLQETPQYPMHVSVGVNRVVTLPEGQVLNVSGSAGAAGVVYRLDPVLGGTNSLQSWTIGAGALAPIGPYAGEQRFLVTCSAGSVDASMMAAVLGAPRVVKNVAGLADSAGALLPATGPAGVLNFNPARMRKWCAAKARVLSKSGRGVVALMGDSRTTGFGAAGTANFVGARAKNRAAQLAAILNAQGLPAHTDSFFCDGNINSVGATVPQYDPRITMGAGWINSGAFNVVQWTGFGIAFSNLTTLNAMTFTPDNPTDTADVYYLTRPGFGSFTISVGGNVIKTVDANVAQSIKKETVTFPRGANTITFMPVALGSGVFVYGCDCYDSTMPKISVWTLGNSGGGVANLIYNTYPWEGTQPFKLGVMTPDVVILDIGVNDANSAMALATYSQRLTTIVDNVQTGGSNCILSTFLPASLTSWPRAAPPLVQPYWDAITSVALAKGLPLIDHASRFGSYELANPLGLYADTLHQNGVAMADQAQVDGAVLLAA
ncbi:SGNH/GDSL hydrolase family protein [Janthinobacterium sp. MDT1-19]|uniref:SGNH/GDSL hydrolase family protein n=1 Tax=Janthinobacterium sp. MDT1-19 TaxID=1259339 RepID=UPI003F22C1E1